MPKTFHEHCDEIRMKITQITPQEVIKIKDGNEDFMLIDIREDNEWDAGRIKGAIHVGKGIIERDIHLHVPEHDRKIVLYCGGGYRSVLAADSLQKMGYTNVISMDGGWKAWNALEGEIER